MHVFEPTGRPSLDTLDPKSVLNAVRDSGVVLLSGFQTPLAQFEAFTRSLCPSFHIKRGPRVDKHRDTDGLSTQVPLANFNLLSHCEGAYRPHPPPPDLCFFNCHVAPDQPGGETSITDGAAFLARLPTSIRERFASDGLQCESLWEEWRWRVEFQVDTLDQLLARHKDNPDVALEPDGECLRVRCRVPAIRAGLDGHPAFCNPLLAHLPVIPEGAWPGASAFCKEENRSWYGDGAEISEKVLRELITIDLDLAKLHRWQAGDLLILDNLRVMHGRRRTVQNCERVIRSRFGFIA